MRADGHVRELDGVRGVACLLVVLWHCLCGIMTPNFVPGIGVLKASMVQLMVGGVDLFFVLSGFLIGGILLDHRAASNYFPAFWARRAGRILPVYVLLLSTYIVGLAIRPHVDAPWLDDFLLHRPLPLWSYATFTQNYVMAFVADTGALWVAITWSLAVEEQFYLLFPIAVYFLSTRALIVGAVSCIVFAFLLRIVLGWIGNPLYAVHFPTPARVDTLMLGFLVASIVRSEGALALVRRWRVRMDVVALVLLVVATDARLAAAFPTAGFTVVAVLFAYVILRVFIVDDGPYRGILRSRFLVWCGGISYAWYMYHQMTNGLVHGLLFKSEPLVSGFPQLAAALLVLVLSASLAALSSRFYEQPFRKLARRVPYRFERTIPDPIGPAPRGVTSSVSTSADVPARAAGTIVG